MNLTLLLDLDDTLLDTRMDAFIPAYFQSLSGYLAEHIPPEEMLKHLMLGTHKMLTNTDPARTLQQVFDADFFPPLGMPRETLQPLIDRFYEERFPDLQSKTGGPKPGAGELVAWAFEQGYTIAIATNPLFPLRAIEHRLAWAGLPPERYPFALISSYETFHFSKSTPAYYAECLGRLGWPAGPVLMVGDDEQLDILPSRQAGLAAFSLHEHGGLSALRPWLEAAVPEDLQPVFTTPTALDAVLRSTPAALSGLLSPLPAPDWAGSPRSGEWSPAETLCHLRDVEIEVNLPRLRAILEQDNPFIAGQVTDVWASERDYASQDGVSALNTFTAARLQTLGLLAELPAESWLRPARHAIFGPTTLQELVGFMAEHDRVHVQQVWESLPKGIIIGNC